MLTTGNGTAYEILWATDVMITPEFQVFKDNKHWFLNTKCIAAAHIGYADSQLNVYLRKAEQDISILDKPNAIMRIRKAAVAGIRILHQAKQLLATGDFAPRIADYNEVLADSLFEMKNLPDSEININFIQENIDRIEKLKQRVRDAEKVAEVRLPDEEAIKNAVHEVYLKY